MSKTVTIRLSEEEYKKISLSAQSEYRPISNFITNTVLKEIEESLYTDVVEIDQIRGNKKLLEKLKLGHNDAKKMRGNFIG
ncbi:MAG: CopG family transcriptional regulator [Elusimicrobiota bacterium]